MILTEAIISKIIRAAARQAFKTKGLTSRVNVTNPSRIRIPTPTKNITGFRTGGMNRGANFDPMKGSKYQFKPGTPGTNPIPPRSTSFTAPGHHKTPAGRKPETDATVFTTRQYADVMRSQRIDGADWNTGKKYTPQQYKAGAWKSLTDLTTGQRQRIPVSGRPQKGSTPIEIWDNYPKGVEYRHGVFSKGGERMTHTGSPIVDIQTKKGGSNLPLYGQQRREIQQRVRRALRNPRAKEILNKDIKQGNEASLNNLYQQRNNPQNPNTLENELRGRYRGKGVGRKETTNEQIAPLKSNFVGPNLESLPHMDLRGPGQKLKSVMYQKKFWDSKWGRMQGGPPKGP